MGITFAGPKIYIQVFSFRNEFSIEQMGIFRIESSIIMCRINAIKTLRP